MNCCSTKPNSNESQAHRGPTRPVVASLLMRQSQRVPLGSLSCVRFSAVLAPAQQKQQTASQQRECEDALRIDAMSKTQFELSKRFPASDQTTNSKFPSKLRKNEMLVSVAYQQVAALERPERKRARAREPRLARAAHSLRMCRDHSAPSSRNCVCEWAKAHANRRAVNEA